MAGALVIGVDLGGTQVRAGVVDEGGVLAAVAEPTPQESAAAVLEAIVRVVARVREAAPAPVAAVGIGSPGPLDPAAGVVFKSPNLPEWEEIPLKAFVEARTGLPAALDNDANVAGLAEYAYGAGRGARILVYITVSTGIGGGIVLDGKMLQGVSGAGGEIGHHVVVVDGPTCGCGRKGCWEALASGTAIARRTRERLAAAGVSGEGGLAQGAPGARLWAEAGGRLEAVRAEHVFAADAAGDPLARAIVDESVRYLTAGVANLVQIFNPDRVVIGGGVAKAGERLFQPLRAQVLAEVFPSQAQAVEILPAALGDDVGILGAAALARSQLDLG